MKTGPDSRPKGWVAFSWPGVSVHVETREDAACVIQMLRVYARPHERRHHSRRQMPTAGLAAFRAVMAPG